MAKEFTESASLNHYYFDLFYSLTDLLVQKRTHAVLSDDPHTWDTLW